METLHPGLYLQEVPGESPLEGVSTSTGAFVGVTERGAIGKSGLVTSWKEFQTKYGGYLENSYLAYAVRGFFENGGTRAFISRAVHYSLVGSNLTKASAPASYEIKADINGEQGVVGIIDAHSDGTWGNYVEVDIKDGKDAGTYTITVYERSNFVETFANVPVDELEDTINSTSTTIKLTLLEIPSGIPNAKVKLAGGNDGLLGLASTDYVGDPANKSGLYAFDNDTINIVAIPGITDVGTLGGLTSYVEGRKDCVAILDAPYGLETTDVLNYVNVTANIASARANVYNTWIQVSDPIGIGKNPTKFIPPSGHIAGIYARTDNSRGVFKAPAGLEAVVRGAIGLAYNVNDAEQDLLNPEGINAIRAFDGEGIILWGARTRSSSAEYKYIPVRRSADYVGQSVLAGTRWAVFEPNDEVLWDKITSVVSAFMRGYWRAGGLKGTSESEAFFVECNGNTTTPDDVDAGRLYANIGMAPQKPAEFIIFRLSLLK